MRNQPFLFFLMLLCFYSCKKDTHHKEVVADISSQYSDQTYDEQFRPQFHFSPPEKWMNDPNGLVFHKGVYHLFYQYYPEDIVWGPMHWGHAVSKDMIHWENKPIALYPDELGFIFSGSAVVDHNNSSGFGTKENPPLVAIFTYHDMEGEKAGTAKYQTQGIAFSLDNGDTWTKYAGNPVIPNEGIKDFRDPKVFWHEAANQWIMSLVAGDHAKFYASANLKNWKLTGQFGKDNGAHGGVWECPDLFKLKVEGTAEEKWVLLISINPGAPNGGSGTQYFIGDFDGNTFTSEHDDIKWIDYGTDNYAGVTYNNVPNNDRLFIGWMSNWNYARDTPTKNWRSAMTLPRVFSLHKEGSDYFTKHYPIKDFENQLNEISNVPQILLNKAYTIKTSGINADDLRFQANLKDHLEVKFKNSKNEQLTFSIDPDAKKIILDRTQSGIVNFEKSFGEVPHEQDFMPLNKEVEIRLILDRSSIEIFIDGGRYVFTDQVFPEKAYEILEMSSKNESTIKDFKLHSIKSIWQ